MYNRKPSNFDGVVHETSSICNDLVEEFKSACDDIKTRLTEPHLRSILNLVTSVYLTIPFHSVPTTSYLLMP